MGERHEGAAGFGLSNKLRLRFARDFLMLQTGREERRNPTVPLPAPVSEHVCRGGGSEHLPHALCPPLSRITAAVRFYWPSVVPGDCGSNRFIPLLPAALSVPQGQGAPWGSAVPLGASA